MSMNTSSGQPYPIPPGVLNGEPLVDDDQPEHDPDAVEDGDAVPNSADADVAAAHGEDPDDLDDA
jgi:hypothetical protein